MPREMFRKMKNKIVEAVDKSELLADKEDGSYKNGVVRSLYTSQDSGYEISVNLFRARSNLPSFQYRRCSGCMAYAIPTIMRVHCEVEPTYA